MSVSSNYFNTPSIDPTVLVFLYHMHCIKDHVWYKFYQNWTRKQKLYLILRITKTPSAYFSISPAWHNGPSVVKVLSNWTKGTEVNKQKKKKTYRIRPNYHTYTYKCTVKQFSSL